MELVRGIASSQEARDITMSWAYSCKFSMGGARLQHWRAIAEEHGLKEGEGSYSWRDRANAAESDACLAFLTTKPKTGKGTMLTVNIFVSGKQEFVDINKPSGAHHLAIPASAGQASQKPVLIFWDITDARLPGFAAVLRQWLDQYKPARLMVAGPMEDTWPGIERLGATLLAQVLAGSEHVPGTHSNVVPSRTRTVRPE